jgi:hypothetical protein
LIGGQSDRPTKLSTKVAKALKLKRVSVRGRRAKLAIVRVEIPYNVDKKQVTSYTPWSLGGCPLSVLPLGRGLRAVYGRLDHLPLPLHRKARGGNLTGRVHRNMRIAGRPRPRLTLSHNEGEFVEPQDSRWERCCANHHESHLAQWKHENHERCVSGSRLAYCKYRSSSPWLANGTSRVCGRREPCTSQNREPVYHWDAGCSDELCPLYSAAAIRPSTISRTA